MKISKEQEKKKVISEFDALTKCKHGLAATSCWLCKGKEWENTPTVSGETIGQIIDDFAKLGKIDRIELKERINKKTRNKRIKKITALAGIAIVGGLVVYEGGKVIARLFGRRAKN